MPLYEPLFLNDIAPVDRFERRKWISGLCLPFSVMLYKYAYGNNLGTLIYAWRIPQGSVDSTIVSKIFSQLCRQQSFHSSRAMRRDFLNKYSHLANVSKMVLRHMYRHLLQDSSAAECALEAQIDERVVEAVMHLDDPDIVLDLRRGNGRPNSTVYDVFWEEVQKYFDESTLAVDERRHGDVLHMPLAISIRHLKELITQRLRDKFPNDTPSVPSEEWIRLQFWPANPYSESAIRHTGRFKVRFGVQIRQQRKDHPDSHYVSALLKYVKSFSVRYRNHALLVSVDDKCIVPVGEPSCHVSTGVRGHNRSIVPVSGPQLLALDHDFHIHGIVPSVAFFINVPESESDSFFRGNAFVTNKDKVTQPSNALRHATEVSSLVRNNFSEDGTTSANPIIVIVSDGGSDHRVTFKSVQVACITLFCSLDLDMLICVRTCPYQSWQNVAERIMSTLNLALQNVALARNAMSHRLEELVKNANSLSEVRDAITKYPELYGALQDSMSTPLITVGRRFQAMKVKDNPIQLGVPATETQITDQFQYALNIDPSLNRDDLTAKGLKDASALHAFMESHCHASQYVFQVKKCSNLECSYCSQHPIRLSHEVFSDLSYIPLPLLDSSKEHYKKFSELYGVTPSDNDRPSRKPVPSEASKETDKNRRGLLVCGKVRCCITCIECYKPRCVYSRAAFTLEEKKEVLHVVQSNLYTCGSPFFPSNSTFSDTIVTREALVCSSYMETQYYSSVMVHFPPVCYYCGAGEETLVNDETIKELKESYATVYPLCFLCQDDGKTPHCKQPTNVAKRRKT